MIKRKILTAALLAVGLFGSLEYKSIAQTNTSPSPQNQPATSPTTSPSSQDQPTTTPTTTPLSSTDRQFMLQAADGGMAEVQFAQVALDKASSDVVKQYAQRMIDEHTQVNNQLMTLASQKGVTLPQTISSKNQSTLKQLSQLSGARFDKAYISTAGIKAHSQQASLFQNEVKRGKDPDVKAFAAQVLPAVQDHLQTARSISTGTTTRSQMNH